MTLRSFKHINSTSIEQAASILAEYKDKAAIIAGGTDLLGLLKDNVHPAYAELLVNLKTVPGMEYIREDGDYLKIGALTTIHAIATTKIIREKYFLLAEAARSVASPQLRNMGTIGGNICQEPRCWYYRNPENRFYCIRKGGKTCPALTGDNRYHSIFGAGKVVSTPCSSACPGGVDIPSYLSRIRDGNLAEAAKTLLNCNPMPAITGQVCPHYCEKECNRGEFDESVSIRAVERFMGDYILDNFAEIIKPPESNTGKTIAIVGSGPAGLSAAYYLRNLGHHVTVFDRMEEPGGMLMYGIPAYRLSKDVVRKQVKALEGMGIEFKSKVDVGVDVTLEELKKSFDSIFVANGAWGQPSLGIEGEELLLPGLQFLTSVNRGLRKAPGRKVLMIGGGNVAVDVAITALRLGAKEVTMACLECREEMPAFPEEIEQAVAEGVKLMPSWGPFRVLTRNGNVSGMELVRCTSVFDSEGRFNPTFDEGVRETVEADRIVLAIGQRTDLSFVGALLNVERGLIVVDENTQATNLPGVFAGGDVTTGAASVIAAIASGRRAANSIDHYLRGRETEGKKSKGKDEETAEALVRFNGDYLQRTSRVQIPMLPISERSMDTEDVLGLGLDQIELESNRCFNCGCVAVNASDVALALLALNAKIKTTKRTVEAENFFATGTTKTTVLAPDEVVTEILLPTPRTRDRQSYIKFRIRNSIDFPIISVATVFNMNSSKIKDAKIAIGAAAPVPLRLREAENFLKGKVPSEEVAKEVSIIATKGVIPLAGNKHKAQIIKALLRRAILSASSENR